MNRVLIIHTGGTFGMTPAEPDKTLKPGNLEKQIDTYIPRIREKAEISIIIPFNLDSSNIGPEEWRILYQIIRDEINQYDGVVIIHGTDTLVYTAAALSFLLLDINKPVILTGAQRPLSALRTDARENLINSVELATYDIPEVLVCFGNRLFRGNRTKKMSIESFQSFDSPNYPALAEIGLNVNVNQRYILTNKTALDLAPRCSKDIFILRACPGKMPKVYTNLLSEQVQAFIIEGFGSGNLPISSAEWIDFISTATSQNILVFLGSQAAHGLTDLSIYVSGHQAREAGALPLNDMTTEAALVKLMLLLGNKKDLPQVGQLMGQSLAGEVAPGN
jgi:L-asparaginase